MPGVMPQPQGARRRPGAVGGAAARVAMPGRASSRPEAGEGPYQVGQEVEVAIEEVESVRHRMVLRLYYAWGLKWNDVAVRMHYDRTHCLRLRDEALVMLDISRE